MTVEMPDPSAVTLPPADTLRCQIAAHLRAAHILRGLLRVSESVADRCGRPARPPAPDGKAVPRA